MKAISIRMRLHRLAVFAAAGLAAVFAASTSSAQMTNFQDLFRPDFEPKDRAIMEKWLQFDDGQKDEVSTMIEIYREDLSRGIEQLREQWIEKRGELENANADNVLKMIFGPIEDWSRKKEQMRQQFIDDLRTIVLTPHQQEVWPRVERELNRMKYLTTRGELSGESVDLFTLLRSDMGMSDDEIGSLPVLVEYEVAMDEAVKARNRALLDSDRQAMGAIQSRGEESGEFRAAVERLIGTRVAVRDINEMYATKVAEILPPRKAAEFTEAFREKAYPRVFRTTRVERLFKAAMEHPAVPSEKQPEVVSLYRKFQEEMKQLNENLIAASRVAEPQRERAEAEAYRQRIQATERTTSRRRAEDPMREEFRKRDEAENRYLMDLSVVLGDEVFEQLPGATKGAPRSADRFEPGRVGENVSSGDRAPVVAPPTQESDESPPNRSGL